MLLIISNLFNKLEKNDHFSEFLASYTNQCASRPANILLNKGRTEKSQKVGELAAELSTMVSPIGQKPK